MGAQLTQQQLASCCVAPDMTKIVHSHQDEKNQLLTTNVWLNLVSTVRNQMCLNDQHNWLTKANLFLFIFFWLHRSNNLGIVHLFLLLFFQRWTSFSPHWKKRRAIFCHQLFLLHFHFSITKNMTKRQNTTARNEVFPKDITRFSKKTLLILIIFLNENVYSSIFFCFKSIIYQKSSIIIQCYKCMQLKNLNFETMIFFEGNLHSTFHIQPYIFSISYKFG